MKKIFVFAGFVLIFLSGCVQHKVEAQDMIADMKRIQSRDSNAHINILWYKGSDAEFHYFSYVYKMVGTRYYKILKEQLYIKENILLTDDSNKWILVNKINGIWFSSSKYDGVWVESDEGIDIELRPE